MTTFTRAMRLASVALLVAGLAVAAPPSELRPDTNVEAILAHPDFFHARPVVLVGQVGTSDRGEFRLTGNTGSLRVVYDGQVADGLAEVRGQFFDIGRIKPDDPRVQTLGIAKAFHLDPSGGSWPRPGQISAVFATTVLPMSRPDAPSIRAIALFPDRYVDQRVTIVGQYSGRNLFGDLPDAPGRSRWDFVLRSSDAAIWVTNIQPKGKDFDLSLDRRLDTGKWLEVSGTVRQRNGIEWVDAEPGTLMTAKPPVETTEEAPIKIAPGPPPEVIFSVPTDAETDVPPDTAIRIQLSRDLDPSTVLGNIHVGYLKSETVERGEPVTPTATFSASWSVMKRELILKFTNPLERFRMVKIELTDGIKGTDGQPLKPWTLTFTTGG